jgi:oligopeptide/dipeptide ABC transporter ATP-binding protein
MEVSPADELYTKPIHPYTSALLSAIPIPDPRENRRRERLVVAGEPPNPIDPPSGCVFHPRCHHPAKDAACAKIVPPLEEKAPGHFVACIKQTPTKITWEEQKQAGGVHPPERYLPLAAVHA